MKNIFRTTLNIAKDLPLMDHSKSVFLIGSCFSDNIGGKLREFQFRTCQNPFGVSYNPISIAQQLMRICDNRLFTEKDVMECNGGWNSFELHGSFLSNSPGELVAIANDNLKRSREMLIGSGHLFITLGTAWVYRLKESGNVVNNCHKLPSDFFSKDILEVKEVVMNLSGAIEKVKNLNPKIQLVYNLSPVRHLKDGFEENSLSKSILRISIDQLAKITGGYYFPSYEILMDDLRDYRFYSSDMLHPSESAVEYIWEKLTESMFTDKSRKLLPAIDKLNKALKHRAFKPDLPGHKAFLRATLDQATSLKNDIDLPGLEEDIEKLKNSLTE